MINPTWYMYQTEESKESPAHKNPPKIQFKFGENWSVLYEIDECSLKIGGPWYNMTTNAPAIDTIVPIALAWLLECLQYILSILIKPLNWDLDYY